MSGQQRDQYFRAEIGPFPGQRRMSASVLTTSAYVDRIASALGRKWGTDRSAAKQVARACGAGVGTARKWLAGENGPSGEHLLRLAAKCDEVWAVVLEMSGRDEAATAEQRQRMLRAAAILRGEA